MYIEDEVVKIYFRNVSTEMILKGKSTYRNFPKKEFNDLMFCYLKEYSETEGELLYQYMGRSGSREIIDHMNHLNVFYALEHTVRQILVLRDNEVQCKFSELLRWRNISSYIGEDLPVCAFLASWSKESGKKRENFDWDLNINHTNIALNKILQEGISDNHFHLFGSAPVFQLIWLKLMNDVHTNQYRAGLRRIDEKRRNHLYFLGEDRKEVPLECMVLQAALIRVYLFAYINNIPLESAGYLYDYLKSDTKILDVQKEIREVINYFKSRAVLKHGVSKVEDYACINIDNNTENCFSGERNLIYQLLYDMLVKENLPDAYANMLYAYLVIRSKLWAEIVQANENIGFENFSVYQGRKKYFLGTARDSERMIQGAVGSSFKPGNLKSLEIRITPSFNYLENAKQILYFDKVISQIQQVRDGRYYYVYHFPKCKDRYVKRYERETVPCRDAEMREKAQKWGSSIIKLRERMPVTAARIRGIDACSQEIACRPEVFACTFRRLQNHIVSFLNPGSVGQLKQTYHAGEDFLDIVDGLRALDEAVHFFNMRNGDRLGHATVLGISVRKWYETKHNVVIMPIQDYLDNITWLYHKILEFQIDGCEHIKSYLLQQYDEYFYQIYAPYIEPDLKISINLYYDAWKLRGDKPELYKMGRYCRNLEDLSEEGAVNLEFPENQGIRLKREVAQLYYHYHYNWDIRKAGNFSKEFAIPPMYIDAVEKVQKKMQHMIGMRGVGIETNPSSNLVISTMRGYEEHPILNFYNLGLSNSEIEDCPQLCVSINTDDKGVFYTSLENEYALMAAGLENIKDTEGKKRYNRQEIYDWINRIRVMGNRQAF